jgi:hypothetical protein
MVRRLLSSWLLLAAIGCAHSPTHDPQPVEASGVGSSSPCQARLPFPDPNCTPGALNPDVTQENIAQTICVPGYTRTIRPPASYTSQLKVRQIVEYGYEDTNPADYEEDHFIPLELGGHPTDPRNLAGLSHAPLRVCLVAIGNASVQEAKAPLTMRYISRANVNY